MKAGCVLPKDGECFGRFVMKHKAAVFFALIALVLIRGTTGEVTAQSMLSKGQRLYVPVYSHIYYGDKDRHKLLLAATLSIRNIDPVKHLTVMFADYYNSDGELVEKYIHGPVRLKPLESVRYIVRESDVRGGSGANFIVGWKSDVPVNKPIVEAIMIGARGQQGISFTSQAREIFDK